jgi:hypothetical protein
MGNMILSLSASCAQAQKSLEHSVDSSRGLSLSYANLAPQTRHIRHRLSCASVPPDFIDQKEKGISDQSEGEIDESGMFHCFPHYKCTIRNIFEFAPYFIHEFGSAPWPQTVAGIDAGAARRLDLRCGGCGLAVVGVGRLAAR